MIDFAFIGLVVFAIIVLLLAVGIGVLLVPSRLFLTISKQGPVVEGNILLKWLGRKVIDQQILGPPKAEVVGREKVLKKLEVKRALERIRNVGEAAPHLFPVMKSLFRSTSFERLRGELFFGLEDPVDTAVVYGFISSIVAVSIAIPNSSFMVTPVFGQSVIDGSLTAQLKVRPFRLVLSLLRSYTHKPVRNLIREMRS